MRTLFSSQTANGQSETITWHGGTGTLVVAGTFDGATVSLQCSPDNGTTWIAVGTDSTLTAAGVAVFQLSPGNLLRLDLSIAGASTSITAWLG